MDSISYLLKSIVVQFGPILWFGLGGLIFLAAERKRLAIVFMSLVMSSYTAIHLLDNVGFIGYSRFNIMLLPALLCLSSVFLNHRRFLSRKSALACLLLGLTWNYFESPILADGSRSRNWGDSRYSVAEFSYPVREACDWINRNTAEKLVCVTGHTYTYHFWSRYLKHPGNCFVCELSTASTENERFQYALSLSASRKYDYLMYMVVDDCLPDLKNSGGYELQKLFENKAGNVILILKKKT